jgi:hypothetical protein
MVVMADPCRASVLQPPQGLEFRVAHKSPAFCRWHSGLQKTLTASADRHQSESRSRNACIELPVLECRTPDEFLDLWLVQTSFGLQSEPESNDALGTEDTKNAAAKGSAHDPVFSGIRAKNDKDLPVDRGPHIDSVSPDMRQSLPPAAGAERLATYIGLGLRCNRNRDGCQGSVAEKDTPSQWVRPELADR